MNGLALEAANASPGAALGLDPSQCNEPSAYVNYPANDAK